MKNLLTRLQHTGRIFFALLFIILISEVGKSQTWQKLFQEAEAQFHQEKGYDRCIALGQQALHLSILQYGEQDTNVAMLYDRLGEYYRKALIYDTAKTHFLQALEIQEQLIGAHCLPVAQTLFNLGKLYKATSFFPEAEQCLLRSLSIHQELLGSHNIDFALCMVELAATETNLDKYSEAVRYYKRAIEIQQDLQGEDVGDLSVSYRNLAVAYMMLGSFDEGEKAFFEALRIARRAYGEKSIKMASIYHNLGKMYLDRLDFEKTASYAEQSIAIKEATLVPDDPLIANTLVLLAGVHAGRKEYQQEESLYVRALQIREKRFGNNHRDVAYSLRNYGNFLMNHKRYTEAKEQFVRLVDVSKNVYGSDHYEYGNSLNDLGSLLRKMSNYDTSLILLHNAFEIKQKSVMSQVISLPEKEALQLSRTVQWVKNDFLSALFDLQKLGRHDYTASDIIFLAKGNVSDAMFLRNQGLRTSNDDVTTKLIQEQKNLKNEIASLYTKGTENKPFFSYLVEIDSLNKLLRQCEWDLTSSQNTFQHTFYQDSKITKQIVSSLHENESLIEFIQYDYIDAGTDASNPRYYVLVANRNEVPTLVDIGEAAKIDTAINHYRQHLLRISGTKQPVTNTEFSEYRILGNNLYKLIIKPIRSKLRYNHTLFIASDGSLNLVSFAGLVDDRGKYLIEKYPIHYLSAGRDLIRLKNPEKSGSGLLAFGDPDYDASVSERQMNKSIASTSIGTQGLNPYQVRNVRSGCTSLHEMKVMSLPGTHSEVEAISTSWHNNFPNELSTIYFGPEASEEHLKKDISGKRIIHLATHGYYINGECADKKNKKVSDEIKYAGENPLLLSGLLLAGANLHGAGADAPAAEDGILTALEVSSLDLHGTELVVLSACETGLGKVEQGEGVYGLRRALQLAGAKTVVSSLWRIPDRETSTFMKILYSQNAKTYPELFQKTAIQRLNELRLRKQSTHPYIWAGFIATGNWRIGQTP